MSACVAFPPVMYISSVGAGICAVPTADAVVTGKVNCYNCIVRFSSVPSFIEAISQGYIRVHRVTTPNVLGNLLQTAQTCANAGVWCLLMRMCCR